MNSIILAIALVVRVIGADADPFVAERFETEAQCKKAAKVLDASTNLPLELICAVDI